MSALEKLVRTLESLRLVQTPSLNADNSMSRQDRMTHCRNLADGLCGQVLLSKSSPNEFTKYLTVSMEMFFALIDDPDLDVRTTADEQLNRVIRTLTETHCGRLQVELYKEVKKNGSTRCLRGALSKFAELAHLIRPQKCRAFVVNLLPCLVNIARRQEESIHETLAQVIPKIFSVIGHFTNENEVNLMLKTYMANLFDTNPVIRRNTAICLNAICVNSPKPEYYLPWLLAAILDFIIVPLNKNEETPTNRILGILTCARIIMPGLGRVKGAEEGCELLDRLLQLYELCLHFLTDPDSTVMTHSLETLHALLRHANFPLKNQLTSTTGIAKSRIYSKVSEQNGKKSTLSRMNSLMMSEEEESLLDLEPSITETPRGKVQMIDEEEEEEDKTFGLTEDLAAEDEPVFRTPTPEEREEEDFDLNETEFDKIGHFCDSDIPLIFCARKLVMCFLLTKEKGVFTPNSVSRVSMKVLALNCLTEVLSLSPKIFLLTLFCDQDEEDQKTPLIRDLTNYVTVDNQLSGGVAVLLGTVLRGALIEGGGNIIAWFNHRRPDQEDIIGTLLSMANNSKSSVLMKLIISGISLFLRPLLLSPQSDVGLALLHDVISLLNASNCYWLVKQEFCDLICILPFDSIFFLTGDNDIQDRLKGILFQMATDDDPRVRSKASACLAIFVRNCYFNQDDINSSPLVSNLIESKESTLDPITNVTSNSDLERRSTSTYLALRVSRCVNEAYQKLKVSKENCAVSGLIEVLRHISDQFKPEVFPLSWGFVRNRARRPSTNEVKKETLNSGQHLLYHLISIVTKTSFATDLSLHTNILHLATRLFVANDLSQSAETARFNDDIFKPMVQHCVRLLSLISAVASDPATSSVPASKNSNNSTSPVKKKLEHSSAIEKLRPEPTQEKKMGNFSHLPWYVKQFESLQTLLSFHKTSMDSKHMSKIRALLGNALDCLTVLFGTSLDNPLGKHTEEFLGYTKVVLSFAPKETLECVQSLLGCIFKTNARHDKKNPQFHGATKSMSRGLFYPCFDMPYLNIESYLNPGRESIFTHSSKMTELSLSPKGSAPVAMVQSDRVALASYIRLFEPTVIKALKHYTLTSNVEEQKPVLCLLSKLVRLRVNYCLLDSDQIFIGYVLKQVDLIEEKQVLQAEILIPQIFKFLLLLSFEKNHSKPIIDIPKITSLCEKLFPINEKHALCALAPVTEDLFCNRNVNNVAGLESHREMVFSMLLKLITMPETLKTVNLVLAAMKCESEEKWRKTSRMTVDVLIPLLSNQKIRITTCQELNLIGQTFENLTPVCLRPVDSLIGAVLTCAVDLSNLDEVQRWLAFVCLALPIILKQSPEEGILSRLEELGIHIGNDSASGPLNTSVESSTSTNSDPLGLGLSDTKPEVTLAKFLIQVIGAACSKYHQLCYSQYVDGDIFLLSQELSRLVLIFTYMLQSERHPRVAKAAKDLASLYGDSDMMYTVDMVSELFIQLAHKNPYLTLQWLNVVNLLDSSPVKFWKQNVLNPCEGMQVARRRYTSYERWGFHKEVLRKGGVVMMCQYLSNHQDNVEACTWFVVKFVQEIILAFDERPVKDFVRTMHTSSSTSGLLLQAVATKGADTRKHSELKRLLFMIEDVHMTHVGKLILFVVKKFLLSPFLALSKLANAKLCSKVESLISESPENVKLWMQSTELAEILDTIRNSKVSKRYGRLVILLNRVSLDYFELSPIESDELRTFNPGTLINVTVDKDWFISLLRSKCTSSQVQAEVCANLLRSLEFEQILKVMQAPCFNLKILAQSMSRGSGILLKVGRVVMLEHIRLILDNVPKSVLIFQPSLQDEDSDVVKFSQKLDLTFQDSRFQSTVILLLESVSSYLNSDNCKQEDANGELDLIIRFCVLGLEYLSWILYRMDDFCSSRFKELYDVVLAAGESLFQNTETCRQLCSSDVHDLAIASVFSISHVIDHLKITHVRLPKPECFKSKESNNNRFIQASIRLTELLEQVLRKDPKMELKLEQIVVGLCRLPMFTTFVRIPPEVWNIGWEVDAYGPNKNLFPILSIDLLQEMDILKEYVKRTNTIGWITRQQFEEIWVSYLGVFSISQEELSENEIKALGECTTLAVKALTSLLVQSTLLPLPGQLNKAKPIHVARDSSSQFLLSPRGQQLTAIQNFIQMYIEKHCPERQVLQVDSSMNLERCVGGSAKKYGTAQVSILYILSAIRHYEGDSSEKSEMQSNKSQSASLFLAREENLATLGIDLRSCLHFLFELYSQFLNSEYSPLILLTETIRSILMLSDMFTEMSNFHWMQQCLTDVLRAHPTEDYVMSGLLCLGVCKAVSITGGDPDSLDQAKHAIEICLRSSHLPAKMCALHGILYVLQSERIVSEVVGSIADIASDYLTNFIQDYSSPIGQCEHHLSVMWSLAFYMIENFQHDLQIKGEWSSNMINIAINSAGKLATQHGIYLQLLTGLERLIVNGNLVGRGLDQVVKLATDLLTESNPSLTIPAIQLFLAGMYSSTSKAHISIETPSGGIEDPEKLMLAMEQMSILFDCVRRSGRAEARLLCEVLPKVLVDFFPAADVINRVISTFISPGQPHQIMFSGILFSVFQQAAEQEQKNMLQEWVLMALPNFIRRHPVSHSMWCLSCFFISACSHNPWLQAIYPHLQNRYGFFQHEDKKIFCLSAREFYLNLKDEKQKKTFTETFEAAAQPNTPYFDLLQSL